MIYDVNPRITLRTDLLCSYRFNQKFPFDVNPISRIEIQQAVSKLKANKAAGSDGAITDCLNG